MLSDVSVVIPYYDDEDALERVLDCLKNTSCEVIVSSEGSRARSLNKGAEKATRPFIWFLHADSQLSFDNFDKLESELQEKPDHLHFFALAFDEKGPWFLNALGANFRSRSFGVPFGDQGFCLSKKNFQRAGRYNEDLNDAEDLMFLWQVRHAGLGLNFLNSTLKTSARKYKKQGWLRLTFIYQWKWLKMSAPEIAKLLWVRS